MSSVTPNVSSCIPDLIEDLLQQIGILFDDEPLSTDERQRIVSVTKSVLEMSSTDISALISRYKDQPVENYYGSAWSFVLESTEGEPLDDLCDFIYDKVAEDCDEMELNRCRLIWWLSCYPEEAG